MKKLSFDKLEEMVGELTAIYALASAKGGEEDFAEMIDYLRSAVIELIEYRTMVITEDDIKESIAFLTTYKHDLEEFSEPLGLKGDTLNHVKKCATVAIESLRVYSPGVKS